MYEAVDRSLRILVPADIECHEFWKELQIAVGQMVVYPPGHRFPGCASLLLVKQPRYDNAGNGAHFPVWTSLVPGVPGQVLFIRGATELVKASETIDLERSVGGSDRDPAESGLQRLEQILAKAAAGGNRQIGIFR